jgi:hypothetical protein
MRAPQGFRGPAETGGFEKDSEYRDTRAALDQMVKELPVIEQKLTASL